jgi:hypothetical protein
MIAAVIVIEAYEDLSFSGYITEDHSMKYDELLEKYEKSVENKD